MQGLNEIFRSVAFSPDSQRLVSGSDDGIVRIWDISTIQSGTSESHHVHEKVGSVFFSADGRMFATASDSDPSVKIWSTSLGNCLQTFDYNEHIVDISFSTDNLHLASTSLSRSIKIWNTETGSCAQSIDKFDNYVSRGALIANGEQLASSSSGIIQI